MTKDDELYKNERLDLSITKHFLSYSGQIIAIEDIKKGKCFQKKANYSFSQSFVIIGFFIIMLGKLRAGFTLTELLSFNTYTIIFNGWDMVGAFLLLASMLSFWLQKDKGVIEIQLKNGDIITFLLEEKSNKLVINQINNVLRQTIRKNKGKLKAEIVKQF
ncbi:hypothetical protein ACJ2A9_03480 [Anaerobacillus sp. MEB173]|uniref:hypothetical protein n=1 Tax=Anaerobacillus sp. MEB173 TaxID=3383345 RepID=UPI003F933660